MTLFSRIKRELQKTIPLDNDIILPRGADHNIVVLPNEQVLLCSGEDFDFMVVALDTGVQVWSSDGKRMIYFFSSKGSGSGSSREEDDSLHTQVLRHTGLTMTAK